MRDIYRSDSIIGGKIIEKVSRTFLDIITEGVSWAILGITSETIFEGIPVGTFGKIMGNSCEKSWSIWLKIINRISAKIMEQYLYKKDCSDLFSSRP